MIPLVETTYDVNVHDHGETGCERERETMRESELSQSSEEWRLEYSGSTEMLRTEVEHLRPSRTTRGLCYSRRMRLSHCYVFRSPFDSMTVALTLSFSRPPWPIDSNISLSLYSSRSTKSVTVTL
jgi:hypothetical protein